MQASRAFGKAMPGGTDLRWTLRTPLHQPYGESELGRWFCKPGGFRTTRKLTLVDYLHELLVHGGFAVTSIIRKETHPPMGTPRS